jgi:putative ubiquitin-RnfH superfamily antitoxin RatB of RatAB toxin-antitoxin module
MMAVEVCYVPPLPAAASLITVTLASGSTVFDAICASGVLARYPEIDLAVNQVGVFGKFVSLARVLADFERVEIYRPLKIDPKVARRERVQKVRADSTEGRKWLPKKLPKQQR